MFEYRNPTVHIPSGCRNIALAVGVLAGSLALMGCGNTGVRYSLDQGRKAVNAAQAVPSLPAEAAAALEDADLLLSEVQKDVGKPPAHLQKDYTKANAAEAVNLARKEREDRKRLNGMIANLATTYLPFGALLVPMAIGLYRKVKENKSLADGLKMAVGSIETAKKPEDAKAQLKKAAHPAVEEAVRAMNQDKAKSPT